MNDLVILRLYFSAARVKKADRWWRCLTPLSLGEYLLRQAKQAGIEQALLHRVIGGYLKGHALAMDTGEIPSPRLPQCLELVGTEALLQSFCEVVPTIWPVCAASSCGVTMRGLRPHCTCRRLSKG